MIRLSNAYFGIVPIIMMMVLINRNIIINNKNIMYISGFSKLPSAFLCI